MKVSIRIEEHPKAYELEHEGSAIECLGYIVQAARLVLERRLGYQPNVELVIADPEATQNAEALNG